jgi:hypothetical protein
MLKNWKFDILKLGQFDGNPTIISIHEMGFGFHWSCQTNREAHKE